LLVLKKFLPILPNPLIATRNDIKPPLRRVFEYMHNHAGHKLGIKIR